MKTKNGIWLSPIIAIGFVLFLINSCKKENVPTLTTAAITNITGNSATCGGTIIDEGLGNIIARGVCWSLKATPTLADSKTNDGAGAGTFISHISGLDSDSTYYVRAYATNSAGTGYGMALSFTTLNYCKCCQEVVYINGVYDHNMSDAAEYCGADLVVIEATPPVTVGQYTYIWECSSK